MNKTDLYTFVTSLLNEIQIDTTLFNSFLDNSQMEIEGRRPWVQLRAVDTSQTVSSGNTFLTAKTLPADFREWYDEAPILLVNSNNMVQALLEVPFSQRYPYRQQDGIFCVDYPNSNLYVMGNITQTYTLHQHYIKIPTLISAADGNSWVFPVRFHKILGLMIAEKWKNGIDYDVFSNAQASQQAGQALAILNEMTRWDDRLQKNMTRGINPFSGELGFQSQLNGTHLV